MADIQWYPGHMAKAKQQIVEQLQLVDICIELIDARAPASSRIPDFPELQRKRHLVAASKADLADPAASTRWSASATRQGQRLVFVNLLEEKGVSQLLENIEVARSPAKRPRRVLVVGIPNVGKSSLINRLAGRASAKVGAKPGITRGRQWIHAHNLQILDTPGILWPKFDRRHTALRLAAIAAIRSERYDVEEAAHWLLGFVEQHYPDNAAARYGPAVFEDSALEYIARRRGCLRSGGLVDTSRAAEVVLQDFRTGKLGRITLEEPPEM